MGLIQAGRVLRLEGHCRVEDAETLVVMLQAEPRLGLDLSACESLHTAVLQAILAFRPRVLTGPPVDGLLSHSLASLLSPIGQDATSSL